MQTQNDTAVDANLSIGGTPISDISSMWEIVEGGSATVVGFVGISSAYLRRMREIGLDVGAQIKCLNKPPFSAPRQFQICDGVFSLDKDIAASIQVSIASDTH